MTEDPQVTSLRPGARLRSLVCQAELVVVKAPSAHVDIRCGGQPMTESETAAQVPLDPALRGGPELGKRYAHEDSGLEVLCTKPGEGTVTVNGAPLLMRTAKPLPSSD